MDNYGSEEAVFLERRGVYPTDLELRFFGLMIRGSSSTKAARTLGYGKQESLEVGDNLYRLMRNHIDAWIEESNDLVKLARVKLMEGLNAHKQLPASIHQKGRSVPDHATRIKYIERVYKAYGLDPPVQTKVEVTETPKGEIPAAVREALDAVYKQAGSE